MARALMLAGVIAAMAGCAQIKETDDAAKHAVDAALAAQDAQEKAVSAGPVITRTSGSWLLGESVKVAPEMSPILLRQIAWQPSHKVSLSELAAYITQKVGLSVDISEVQRVGGTSQTSMAPSGAMVPPPMPMPTSPGAKTASSSSGKSTSSSTNSSSSTNDLSLPLMDVSYQGTVAGLLDFAKNEAGLWWKLEDGHVEFYRSLTKTIYIPAINRKSSGTNSVVATSGPASGSGGGGSGSGSSGSSLQSTGSSSSSDTYDVDVWKTLKDTALTVAGTSSDSIKPAVSVEPSLGSITVTGTPTQVKNVEQWARGLSDKLSQQVMISVSVYSVDLSSESNYSWNPSVIYSKLSNMYGVSLAGAGVPAVSGSLSPMIMSAKAGSSSSLNGSQLAFNALSTLGRVAETVTQSVVTLNGQPAPMQVANEVTYLASSGSTATANVGTSATLTPGVVTTGFTANFLPQIVNGKILLSMDMTNSVLKSIDTVSSAGSSIQTPNVSSTAFQQSVSLTPGAALLLAGIQQDSSNSSRSGVGSPSNFLFGGGIDATRAKKLIAIVITARVL